MKHDYVDHNRKLNKKYSRISVIAFIVFLILTTVLEAKIANG